MVLILASVAAAQESRSEISLQGIGFFPQSTNNSGITRDSNDTGGFLLGYRYHVNRWLAGEASYGFDRDTQRFTTTAGSFGGSVDMNQITGALVVKLPAVARWKLSPYALAGGGALVFGPQASEFYTSPTVVRQTKGVFIYGAGANLPLTKHLSFRAEYRGLLYSTPDFGLTILQPATMTHTAQPSAGLSFRF
jgi:opacity protein-like surface antigen